VRTAEGFWGAGSKESVSLVYEDQVRAIIGSLDGRNGHLAEQVATKSHLSYIETYATEPTLSQAFVPWFMRVVPNDNQQSRVIVKQILREGGNKIVILTTGTYDCNHAIRSLTKTLAQEAGISPEIISMYTAGIDQSEITKKIIRNDPDHLILPFDAPCLRKLIQELGDINPELKIYGTLHFSLGVEKRKEEWKNYEGMYLLGPLLSEKDTGVMKDSHAAYLYDAVSLVIDAILQVGTDREAITDYISMTPYTDGATGNISFDDLGNRMDAARLYQINNGILQLIE
jgi:ABC-type branched-subunit amino acid transport system substrate-binding protein